MSDSNTITLFFTVVVAFVVIRWFITTETADDNNDNGENGNTTGDTNAQRNPNANNANTNRAFVPNRNLQPVMFDRRPVTNDMIEIVQSMAPNLTTEQIRFDLQRTGNIEATVERYLAQGTLPFPPNSNPRPVVTPAAVTTSASTSSSSTTSRSASAPKNSLIDKYNLADRLISDENSEGEPQPEKKIKWSQSKEERQKLLKKQREDMILKARRKLELKEKQLQQAETQ